MSVLENIDDFWTIDKINEIDLSCEPEIKLQIGWCFLNCNCGKRTNSAIQLKYNFFSSRTSSYVICDECKSKLTEDEYNNKIRYTIYYQAKMLKNYIAPLTQLFGNKEFLIPRSNGNKTYASVSVFDYSNTIRFSKILNEYVINVIWIEPSVKETYFNKDVSINSLLTINKDNTEIVDIIKKLKKYYPQK